MGFLAILWCLPPSITGFHAIKRQIVVDLQGRQLLGPDLGSPAAAARCLTHPQPAGVQVVKQWVKDFKLLAGIVGRHDCEDYVPIVGGHPLL